MTHFQLGSPKRCKDHECECHTDASKKVMTPFPIWVGIERCNPYCCSKCSNPQGPVKVVEESETVRILSDGWKRRVLFYEEE